MFQLYVDLDMVQLVYIWSSRDMEWVLLMKVNDLMLGLSCLHTSMIWNCSLKLRSASVAV